MVGEAHKLKAACADVSWSDATVMHHGEQIVDLLCSEDRVVQGHRGVPSDQVSQLQHVTAADALIGEGAVDWAGH